MKDRMTVKQCATQRTVPASRAARMAGRWRSMISSAALEAVAPAGTACAPQYVAETATGCAAGVRDAEGRRKVGEKSSVLIWQEVLDHTCCGHLEYTQHLTFRICVQSVPTLRFNQGSAVRLRVNPR